MDRTANQDAMLDQFGANLAKKWVARRLPAFLAVGLMIGAWSSSLLPQSVQGRFLLLHCSRANAPLAVNLARAFLEEAGAKNIKVEDRSNVTTITGDLRGVAEVVGITVHEPEQSFKDLDRKSSSVDVELTFRREMGALKKTLAREELVGWDALKVIANKQSGISERTTGELELILKGKSERPLQVYVRTIDKSRVEPYRILGGVRLSRNAKCLADDAAVVAAVRQSPQGVGLVGIYTNVPPDVRVVSVAYDRYSSPVPPNPDVIRRTGDYPFLRGLYLYCRTPPKENSVAAGFIAFARSESGQKLVADSGFLPLFSVDGWPRACQDFVSGAQKQSLVFLFAGGGAEVKNKKDIDHLARFLARFDGAVQVRLLGFASEDGSPEQNAVLASRRARTVEQELTARLVGHPNITVGSVGCGAEMPVDENVTPEGRRVNRRAEVWLKW